MNVQSEGQQQHISTMGQEVPLSTLQVRLDTDPILENLEIYLRGASYVTHENDEGNLETKRIKIGTPLANDEGVQSLLNWVRLTLNPSIVQGNIKSFDNHLMLVKYFRLRLAEYILLNLHNWAIKEEHYAGLVDVITNMISLFLSRLINNKERDSYTNTLQSVETTRSQEGQPGRKFSLFGRRGGQ